MTPTLGLRANLPRGIRRSCYKAHGMMSKGLICLYSMEKLMRTKWRSDQPHNWNAFDGRMQQGRNTLPDWIGK